MIAFDDLIDCVASDAAEAELDARLLCPPCSNPDCREMYGHITGCPEATSIDFTCSICKRRHPADADGGAER